MSAIFKREFKSYFTSPIGYTFLIVFTVLSGIFFYIDCIVAGSASVSRFFNDLLMVLMFLIPILTMKLYSEERKTKTDQLLLTSPVSIPSIVLGKFFAAFCVFAVAMAITLVYVVILMFFGSPDFINVFGNYLAFLLLGSAFIGICSFMSSLTENQAIAAVLGFGVLLVLFFVNILASATTNKLVYNILSYISVYNSFGEFSNGLFNPANIFYYISITFVFLFLTAKTMEKRRWS